MPNRDNGPPRTPGYSHTQQGIPRPLLLAVAVCCLIAAYFTRNDPPLMPVFLAAAVVCAILAFAVGTLSVRDEGDSLAVRFGPLSIFEKAIPYAAITAVAKDRSTFLAGWGIHWTRKGWLWNIGGFDCVSISMGEKNVLIGTDDAEGFIAFLRSRIKADS